MDRIFDVLITVLPSLIVFLTAFYIIKKFMEREQRKLYMDVKMNNQKNVTPVRLQAFERIAIFLERINPTNLVMRVHKSGMSARFLQSELLKVIRSEFEHNVAQQIYMSPNSWKAVRAAKEETIKLINIASSKVTDDSSGMELGKVILEMSSQLEQIPSDFALEVIKREIKTIF
jgi:hypothetical protein